MNKKKKGNTLIEVLIVLGIISTTMLMGIKVIVDNIAELRVNEIEDAANGVMIQGLEIAKSPSNVLTTDAALGDPASLAALGTKTFYRLSTEGNENILEKVDGATPLDDCNTSNEFYLEFGDGDILQSFPTCLQIEIGAVEQAGTGEYVFFMSSRVAYTIPGEILVNRVDGYRFEPFEIVTEGPQI